MKKLGKLEKKMSCFKKNGDDSKTKSKNQRVFVIYNNIVNIGNTKFICYFFDALYVSGVCIKIKIIVD